MLQESLQVRLACAGRIVAQRQPHLHAGRILRRPADVTRGEALAGKAVQRTGFGQLDAGKLLLNAV
ncbi:hypothetical protein D3C72_2092600 [compost metagenome]